MYRARPQVKVHNIVNGEKRNIFTSAATDCCAPLEHSLLVKNYVKVDLETFFPKFTIPTAVQE